MGCYNSCIVDAPVARVWSALRDFHDMSWARGVIESLEHVGEAASDQIGAKRVLNGVFHETLHALNDADRELKYTIDDGPDAVSKDNVRGYVGVVRVLPVTEGDKTFVEWSSSWENSGGGVAEFCNPIYHALLNALQNHFSGG